MNINLNPISHEDPSNSRHFGLNMVNKIKNPLNISHSLLPRLNNCSIPELKKIRTEMAKRVHETLINQTDKPPKLICINNVAAGKDTESIASNDGSSKYLVGGIVNYSQKTDGVLFNKQDAGDIIDSQFKFWEEEGINDFNIIAGGEGYASGDHAGNLLIYAGTKDQFLCEELKVDVDRGLSIEQQRQFIQEVAAIATLAQILTLKGISDSSICHALDAALISQTEDSDGLLAKSTQVEEINQDCWRDLSHILKQIISKDPSKKISIGESFTSGILANLLSSLEGSSEIFDMSLNWYDSRLKKYVGVPEQNVGIDLIAEPETISIASKGLLNKAPQTTGIVIGTTGWANYWVDNEPDYFSVGIATRGEGNIDVSAVKVKVTSTKNYSRSRGRRQLTRQLGVTTALYMLTKSLEKSNPTDELQAIEGRLLETISTHAIIELRLGDS